MYKLTEIYKQLKEEEETNNSDWVLYVDMDGVLTDFDARFKQYAHFTPQDYEAKFGIDAFWKVVDDEKEEFWEQMSWLEPDGKILWDYVKKYNPKLLSAPSRNPTSRVGKHRWVKANLPGVELILADAYNKKNYAGFHKLLVDDRAKNIEQWRASGGTGIHFTSASQTISELKKLEL